MGKSNRLRLSDLRGLYLLVGECRETGRDPHLWHNRMFEGMRNLIGVVAGTAGMTDLPLGRMTFASLHGFATWGLTSREQQEMGQRYWRTNMHLTDPTALQHIPGGGRVVVRRRIELVKDTLWYGSEHFQDFYRPAELDHIMPAVTRFPPESPARLGFIVFFRALGDPPFTVRDRRLAELFLREARSLVGGRLAPFARSRKTGPSPRMRQVLALLLRGRSEKQVARALGISQHTAHNHVKRLHRYFGVASRGELLARCRDWPLGNEQPYRGGAQEGPDYP